MDDYFCVFFDPRGAGLSPRFDKGEITLEKYHDDLNEIINYYLNQKIDQTGIKDSLVGLGGHSFGGLYATSFVNKYPDKISHLILFEPAPLSKEVLSKLIQTSVFKLTDEKWLNQYLYSLEHISYNDHVQADYHRILGFSESFPELAYPKNVPIWRYGAYVNAELELQTFRSKDYLITNNLSSYKGKTLFIWGEKTTALDQTGIKLQMSYFNNPESKIIPNAGHYMTYENPNACVNEIRSFLK
jgi:proline iminopeptidase